MAVPWYYLLIYVVVGILLLGLFDKFRIIKSRSLRYFIVIFVYTMLCWAVYDFLLV